MNFKFKPTLVILLTVILSLVGLTGCCRTRTNEDRGREIGKKIDKAEEKAHDQKEAAKDSMKKGIDKL